MPKELFRRLWGATSCVLCGICASRTPAPGAPHAAAAARVLRLATDPRDALGRARLAVLGPLDRYDAEFADTLKAVCPKAVDVRGVLPSE